MSGLVPKLIEKEGDIDALDRGDAIEFFPDDCHPHINLAVFSGMDEYGKYYFLYEDRTGGLVKSGINRHHLRPGLFGTLEVQPYVTIILPPADMDDRILWNSRAA